MCVCVCVWKRERERRWRWLRGSSCLSCFSKPHPAPPPQLSNQPIRTHTYTPGCKHRYNRRGPVNLDAAGSSQVWMCSPWGRVSLKKNVQAQQIPFLQKCKRCKTCNTSYHTNQLWYENNSVAAAASIAEKHIVSQKLPYTHMQTHAHMHAHTQASCFDKERQRGSVTGSPGEAVVLEKRILMIKDDNI